jgi:hypothetical protein
LLHQRRKSRRHAVFKWEEEKTYDVVLSPIIMKVAFRYFSQFFSFLTRSKKDALIGIEFGTSTTTSNSTKQGIIN